MLLSMAGSRWWRCIRAGVTAFLALQASLALAQDLPSPPSDAPLKKPVRRIAANFDFEEIDNPYPVPRHWVRAQDTEKTPRPGFPRFNEAEFDFAVAHAGEASVKLPARGGNTAMRLNPGVIPVFAEGDYAIQAWVRTSDLRHARAFVAARLLDQASQPIPDTEVRSEPVRSSGQWTEVTLQLIGAPEHAAYLQIELLLLQPRTFATASAHDDDRDHRAWAEDLDAAAWFDDILVYQLPRVEMTTGAGGNIVLTPQRPVMRILVRDFVGERLDAHVVVSDLDDQTIQDARISLAATGRPQEWIPELPALGWYRVSLSVLGQGPDGSPYRVGGTEVSFLWLEGTRAPGSASSRVTEGARADRKRFGIIADRVSHDIRRSLADVGRAIGTGFVTIPIWRDGATQAEVLAGVPAFGRFIDELSQADQQIIVCIPTIPPEVVDELRLQPEDPLALSEATPASWMPYFQPVLDRYGQRLTRWQIGRTGSDAAFWRPDVPADADKVRAQIGTLVPGPRLCLPWRAEFDLPATVPGIHPGAEADRPIGTLVMSYPPQFPAEMLADFVGALVSRPGFTGTAPAEFMIVPELPDTDVFGERAAVIEAARRIVEFWRIRTAPGNAQLPLTIGLDHPWQRVGEHRAQLMPAAALGAMHTLIAHLSEREIIGEYNITPGVRCYILADRSAGPGRPRAGALVAWNESAAPQDAVIRRFLGEGAIQAIDIFGNRAPVERSSDPGAPHVVHVTETPIFIEGIDPMLARFCTLVSIEPTSLPAIQTEHELTLVVSNPWQHAISGKLQIVPPTGPDGRRLWTITPDGIIPFSLGAGQSKRIPWSMVLPYLEETGEKQFSVVVRVTTDRDLPPIMLPMALQVGLRDLVLEPDVQLGPRIDGPDVVLTATVANRGDRSRMLKLEAVAPGFPTRQTLITDLPAGEMVVRRIVLKNAAAQLTGKKMHVSLSDADEAERLNMSVRVP
jgi:hypothetical protein